MNFTMEPEQEEGTLQLYPEKDYTTYNDTYVDTKSNRFALVLGQDNPGTDILTNAITTGDQDRWAQVLKLKQDQQNSQRRNDIIREIATNRDPTSMPTQDEINIVTGLTDDQLYSSDLSTILEENYSRLYTDTISSIDENVLVPEAQEENEEATMEVLDRAQFAQQRTLIAQDKLENVNKRYEDAGLFEKGMGFLKSAIPGYTWWKTADRIDEAPTVSTLSGSNLGEQVSYLYSLPPAEFKATLDKAVDELADDNILLAQQFAQAVVSYSGSDEQLNNLFDIVDLADVATLGLTATGKLAKGVAKAGRAITHNPKNIAKQAAEVGANKTSSIASVIEDTVAGDFQGLTKTAPEDIESRLPSIFAPQKAFTGRSSLESAANNRLRETIMRSSELVKDFFNQGTLVDRLEPEQLKLAANEAFDKINDTFTNVQHHIIDSEVIPASAATLTNTAQAVVKFGKKDGTFFASETSAKNFASRYIGLKTNDFTIEQSGVGGFYVQVTKPIADVGAFRSLEIPTELKSPDSMSNQFLRSIRSADYLVSEPQVRARGAVVHGQEYLAEYMQKITEPFRGKSKQWVSEMDKVFKSNRTNRKYYNTIDEFEKNFLAINGKAPTEDQASAYFTYVQLNDLDWIIRDADIVKQKRRLGGERISFKLMTDKGEPSLKSFDGVVRENLPYDAKSPYNVKVVNDGKVTDSKSSRFFGEAQRQKYDDLITQGYKVVLDPSETTYYLVKDFKRDTIPMGQLNRVEGGHNEYRYSHFIKQPKIKTGADRVARYTGDTSLFVATTQRQAKEIAEAFEKARVMYRDKDPNAKKYIEENLPISYAEFTKKVVTGDIDVNLPILPTGHGQRTADLRSFANDFEFFDDAARSEHNVFAQVGGRYTTERAETSLDVLASENGVVFRTDLESMLDPLETLRTSTGNMLDVRLVNDYKAKSVQDWVQEFGSLLDAHPNQILANPMYYLRNPVYRSGVDNNKRIIAENVRNTILSLDNQYDTTSAAFQNWKEKIISSVYDKAGLTGADYAKGALEAAADAPTFLRRVAFDLKLGLFNPKQLFLQASSVVNVVSVAGRSGISGTRAMPLMKMALRTENPDVLNGLYNKFGKVTGWKKDEFLEMVETFKRSGFATVSNDVAFLDDFRPKTMGNKKVFEYHTMFFKEGERTAREAAWATAYREWRDKNPGRTMSRFDQGTILARAKNLTTNMTRESNAAWQKGWASVATQFMGYQARFMEQLWDGGLFQSGRKLTALEKRRLMFGMSVMYGAPVMGGGVAMFPMRDYLRDWMASEGVVYDDTALEPFLDGIVPSIFEAMSGQDMSWSEAYGPNGLPLFSDLLNEDATWYDVFGGASGSIMADLAGSGAKALSDIWNDGADSTWPVLAQDLIEPLKNISTVNSAVKLFEAINTQRYLSRKGTHLTNISLDEAITSAIFGVNPDRVSEAYSQIAAIRADKDNIQKYQSEVQKNTEMGIEAARRGDEESAERYFSRAHSAAIRGGLTLEEMNLARKRALTTKPMDESVLDTFTKRVIRRQQLNSAQREE